MMSRHHLGVAIALLVAVGWPLLAPSEYLVSLGTLVLTYATLSQALNLIYGYAGYMAFGQTAFFGLGAYVAARLATSLKLGPWVAIVAAGLAAALFATIVGWRVLRLPRYAFAIVTLVLLMIAGIVARSWVALTNGTRGITALPTPDLSLPGMNLRVVSPTDFYWANLVLTVALLAVLYSLVSSRWGRTLKAINRDELLAASHGINIHRHKVAAFGLASFLAGVAGAFHAFRITLVDPTIFDPYYLAVMLLAVMVGGPGSFWGVLVASAVFTILPELLRAASALRLVVYGVLIVAASLAMPDGIQPALANLSRRVRPSSPPDLAATPTGALDHGG
jgi:branched-chain amino acid transport system permease protein